MTGFGIEGHGDHDTIMRASKAAREYVQWASEKQRERCGIAELWVSTKCGESDTTSGCGANPTVGNAFDKLHPLGNYLCFGETTELTGGEHIVAQRCANDAVREKFMFMFNRYQEVINRHKTSDLSDSQPTKGNIAGGLTTIEEKALGNIQKIGRKCTVDGVIDKAEMPDPSGALVHGFVQRRGRDGDPVRGLGLCGALLSHGPGQRDRQPDPAGHQDLRQSAHGATHERAHRRGHLGLLQREITLDQAGDQLLQSMLRTANGRLTAAEALGHREFVLTRSTNRLDGPHRIRRGGQSGHRALAGAGANEAMAASTARALALAQAQGIASHGLTRVAQYAVHLRNGRANGAAIPRVVRRKGGALLVEAGQGLAFPACALAVREGIAVAQELGVCIAGVVNSHHAGVLVDHLRPAAATQLVGLGFSNSPAAMPAAGGRHPVFGTNTVAAVFPRRGAAPLAIDLSLSEVARGKVMVAARHGQPIRWAGRWTRRAGRRPTPRPAWRARCCPSAR